MQIFGPTGSGAAGSVAGVKTVTNAGYTALSSDEYIEVTTGSSNRTITLLDPSLNSGKIFRVKKIDSGSGFVLVVATGGTAIENSVAGTYSILRQYEEVTFVSNGSQYRAMGSVLQRPITPTALNLLDQDTAFINDSGGVWSSYADAAGTSPVDGTGGSPTTSISVSSTSPLYGYNTLLHTKDAANRQGEGFSALFACPSAYYASVLTVEFDYMVASGTFVAGTDSASSDLTVWIYDVTNSTVIPVTPFRLMSNSTTIPGHFKGTFQTSATGASYRLIVHIGSTSASAWTIKFNNFRVSTNPAVYGCPATDWTSYTPTFTGFGTVSNVVTKYRRVGDSIEIIGGFTAGTLSGSAATISLPSGLTWNTITTSKVSSYGTFFRLLSASTTLPATTLGPFAIVLDTSTSTTAVAVSSNVTSSLFTIAVGTGLGSNSDGFSFNFIVPITGWSSNVLMSNDTDTRVVAATAIRGTDQASINPNNSAVKIALSSASFDTHGAFDVVTNNRYVVQVPGYYRVSGIIYLGGANTLNNLYLAKIYKNGSSSNIEDGTYNPTAGVNVVVRASGTLSLVAGDYIELFLFGQGNNSASTLTALTNLTRLSIERVSGPATIAASEKCIALVTGDPASATSGNPIIVPTVSYDSHGAYSASTGRYTCPSGGVYKVYGALQSASSATTLTIYKNAVSTSLAGNLDSNGEATFNSAVNCLAGDIIDIRPGGTVDATNMTLNFERA